jgi:hypothetical protein
LYAKNKRACAGKNRLPSFGGQAAFGMTLLVRARKFDYPVAAGR